MHTISRGFLSVILIFLVGLLDKELNAQKTRINHQGKLEAVGFEIKFKVPLIPLQRGVTHAELDQLNPSYRRVIRFFEILKSSHGNFKLIKQAPDYVWGDTLRARKSDGKMVRVNDLSQLYYVYFGRFVEIEPIINTLSTFDEVEYVHPPAEAAPLVDPNDPLYQAGNQWELAKIAAPEAWNLTKGSSNVLIGIVEATGVANHPDLEAKWHATKGDPPGVGPHGVSVAALAGAHTNNFSGVASLGWNLTLTRYNFSENQQTISMAIDRAATQGNNVINCSFASYEAIEQNGCRVKRPKDWDSVREAIFNAIQIDIVVVAGAGNSRSWFDEKGEFSQQCWDEIGSWWYEAPIYPAAYPDVIAVTATDDQDRWSAGVFPEHNSWQEYKSGTYISLAAPGFSVYALGNGGPDNGTSYSSPLVAALAGLIRSLNLSLKPVQIKDILTSTAETNVQIPQGVGWPNQYAGYGRINAYQALRYAIENYNTTIGGVGETVTFIEPVTIKAGVTLTVLPGTNVRFNPGAHLIVEGTINAQGTSGQHITFDGQGYAPPTSIPDYWKLALLRFRGGGSGTIKYADFKDAKYQLFGESTGNLDIQNSTFVNFGFTGGSGGFGGNAVELFYDIASPPLVMGTLSITNNTFTGTAKLGYGIVVANVQPSTMTITGNAIQDCYMGILAHKMSGTIGANTITDCANGVVANSQSPTFTGLTASGNDKSFFLENASNATVTNCTITGVVQQGIYVKSGSTPLIQSNSISGQSGSSAIYAVDAATNPRVRSNAISNIIEGVTATGGAGARVGEDCSGSNTFTNCGTAVAVMSSAGAVEAKHNSISGTAGLGEGISLQAGGIVQSNLIQNRLKAVSVYNVVPTSIVLNEILNSGYGLFFSNLASPTYSYDLSLNNIVGVSTYHVQNTSSVSVSLGSNWWGVCSEQDVQKSGPVTLTSILQSPQAGTGPCASSGGGTGCPASDLVAYWALDGNLSDGSGNNNGAQGVGVAYAAGVVGQGLQLSGGTGSFAYASDQVYYHITNPTVQAWVKPSSVGAAMTIISEDIQGAWADGRGFFMDVNGGKARFIVGNAAGWKVATGATSLQAGTWYHVAGVYDGTSVKIYLNGQTDGSNSIGAVTISYNPITSAGPNPSTYYIGINHNATYSAPTYEPHLAYPFQGVIDEVRMYNRPLSASEIQQYYNETATPASITVTSPNGGESFSGGGQTNILWSSQSVNQNVQIEYSTDAGSSWTLIVSDLQNSGTYTWTMPSISSTQCKVRVSAMTGSPTDQSDGLFTIVSGDASLVAHWKFESNLNDESTSNNPLTGVGTSYTTGHTGQGLSLNGTTGSFAHTTDQTYYHPSNPSVEAWIKMQGTSGHVSVLTENVQGAWADGRGYFLDVLNGKARFVIGNAAGWKVAQSATTLQLDSWYHVVGTYEGSTLKIYVNGQLDGSNNIGSVTISYAPMANAGPNPSTMYVGIQHNSNNSSPTATSDLYFPFQGVVDEVRIYNRVLTATEVQQHYTGFFGKRAFQDTSKILPPAIAENVPREFGLFQNHPNPFNPETVIRYAVPVQSHVTLRVYDVLGRLVKTLVSTSLKDGFHSVTWDGRDENGHYLSSGVYLCHMIAWGEVEGQQNQFADTRKLILNK